MRSVTRRARSPRRPRMQALPLRALYSLATLARAMGISCRRTKKLLEASEVHVLRAGRCVYVPLSELEERVPELWESIKAAESLRRALDEA